jgi:hypothetical protein
VLGYAAWYEEALFGNSAAEKNLDDKAEDKLGIPESINVELLNKMEKMVGETRGKYLRGLKGDCWCESLDLVLRTLLIQATNIPHDARRGSRFPR